MIVTVSCRPDRQQGHHCKHPSAIHHQLAHTHYQDFHFTHVFLLAVICKQYAVIQAHSVSLIRGDLRPPAHLQLCGKYRRSIPGSAVHCHSAGPFAANFGAKVMLRPFNSGSTENVMTTVPLLCKR